MLLLRAFAGLVFLLAVVAAVLFLSAGTTNYWQAWSFLAVFGACIAAITLYLAAKDRALLERRTKAGPVAEQQRKQKIIQSFASIAFLGLFLIPGLGRRFGWSDLPLAIVILGDALVAVGLFIVFVTFRENSFTSAVIAVDAQQRVVRSGPYGVVRHPMYAGSLLMLVGVPLGLGSPWGLIALLPMFVVIVLRLIDEERFLTAHLTGYAAYRTRVPSRLVPGVW
jgi:protein-S-isoprenylcysteine O-methyltransferase Ste14